MSIKIKNIELEIGEVWVSLTAEQAKELKSILNDAFPSRPPTPSVDIEKHATTRDRSAPYGPISKHCPPQEKGIAQDHIDSMANFNLNSEN
jgi:hypothetical protein